MEHGILTSYMLQTYSKIEAGTAATVLQLGVE